MKKQQTPQWLMWVGLGALLIAAPVIGATAAVWLVAP